MSACVIDASAVLAYLFDERGGDEARAWIDRGAAIWAANAQEVMAKLVDRGTARIDARADLELRKRPLALPIERAASTSLRA